MEMIISQWTRRPSAWRVYTIMFRAQGGQWRCQCGVAPFVPCGVSETYTRRW